MPSRVGVGVDCGRCPRFAGAHLVAMAIIRAAEAATGAAADDTVACMARVKVTCGSNAYECWSALTVDALVDPVALCGTGVHWHERRVRRGRPLPARSLTQRRHVARYFVHAECVHCSCTLRNKRLCRVLVVWSTGVAHLSPMAPSMACEAAGSFARQSPTRVVSTWGAGGKPGSTARLQAPALPPFTLIHGTEDVVVPLTSSRRFAESLVRRCRWPL